MFSGGLDSSYQLLKLCTENKCKDITPIFFNYGQRNIEYEKSAVQNIWEFLQKKYPGKLYKPLIITACAAYNNDSRSTLFPWSLSEPIIGEQIKSNHFISLEIENKNMTLYSLLVSFILSKIRKKNLDEASIDIYTGLRNGEMGDSSSEFFKLINDALLLYHKQFKFDLHFIEKKTPKEISEEIASLLGSRGEADGFIKKTASCYDPKNSMPCGVCSKCKDLNKIWQIIRE